MRQVRDHAMFLVDRHGRIASWNEGVGEILGWEEAETPDVVAGRIRRALEVLPPERLVVAPDCGMKYLPRELAFRKLEAMVEGARLAADG